MNFKESVIAAYNQKQEADAIRKATDDATKKKNFLDKRILTLKAFFSRLDGQEFYKWVECQCPEGVVLTAYTEPVECFTELSVVGEYSGLTAVAYWDSNMGDVVKIQTRACSECGKAIWEVIRTEAINQSVKDFAIHVGRTIETSPTICEGCAQKSETAKWIAKREAEELKRSEKPQVREQTLAERLEDIIRTIVYESVRDAMP